MRVVSILSSNSQQETNIKCHTIAGGALLSTTASEVTQKHQLMALLYCPPPSSIRLRVFVFLFLQVQQVYVNMWWCELMTPWYCVTCLLRHQTYLTHTHTHTHVLWECVTTARSSQRYLLKLCSLSDILSVGEVSLFSPMHVLRCGECIQITYNLFYS